MNQISDETPVLVDLKPVGKGYLEDFHHAGGVGALLRELKPLLHLDTADVMGQTLGDRLDEPLDWVNREVIRASDDPVSPVGGLISLGGNLAPQGAIFKRAAATESLFEHEGRAVVFDSLEHMARNIDDPDLDIEADDIMVLQNAGPVAAGMPEAGYLPIPKKLARQGVKDIVRISDARMSGTAFGTIVLHIAPETARGGPLAAVRTGDRIRLSVKDKSIDLLVDETEIAKRLESHAAPESARTWLSRSLCARRDASPGRGRFQFPTTRKYSPVRAGGRTMNLATLLKKRQEEGRTCPSGSDRRREIRHDVSCSSRTPAGHSHRRYLRFEPGHGPFQSGTGRLGRDTLWREQSGRSSERRHHPCR